MNVIVSNAQRNILSNLDIDIIKSISGEYDASELVEMFKNFFYNKMILDVTSIRDFHNIKNFQTIAMGLDVEKIIFFLPEGTDVCTSSFLSKLVSMGIYNFTTNIEGVKYLLEHQNTYKNVAHIQQLNESQSINNMVTQNTENGSFNKANSNTHIIGVKNVTEHAGATTFIYILKKELKSYFGDTIIAIEINRNDFQYFGDKNMLSIRADQVPVTLAKYAGASVILVDLNDYPDESCCSDILYLLEPTIIKLNKLMKRNKMIFSKLQHRKIILNKSTLTNKDISDFEYEAKAKIFYNMPSLDERKRNAILDDFLPRLGLVPKKEEKRDSGNKIFGLFRR